MGPHGKVFAILILLIYITQAQSAPCSGTGCAPGTVVRFIYTGFVYTDYACDACPIGQVAPGGCQQATCRACQGPNFVASADNSRCVCVPGRGGAGCSICPAGYWSAGGTLNDCTKCPTGMTSPAESISAGDCACRPGFGMRYNVSTTDCFICPPGFWSAGGTLGECWQCTRNRTTPTAGARSAAQCTKCAPGRGGPNCNTCEPGFYSNNSECVPCEGENEISPAGAISRSQCTCAPGYGGTKCKICPRNTWSPGGSRVPCRQCGYGLVSPAGSPSIEYCQCPAGYGANTDPKTMNTVSCSLCPLGTFAVGIPTDAQLTRAAKVRNEILAQIGLNPLQTSNNKTVMPLAVQLSKKQAVRVMRATVLACQFCPNGKTSDVGAKSPSQCYCPAGTYGLNCEKCPAGAYCPGGSQQTLQEFKVREAPLVTCDDTQTSPSGSDSLADCVCAPGYGGSKCNICPVNTYHIGGDRTQCKRCGPGLNTGGVEGADSRDYCQCVPGTAYCNSCKPGTWSNALSGTTSSCNPCPLNKTSDASATDPSQCYCAPGTFETGGGCSPCQEGFYCPGGNAKGGKAVAVACGNNRSSPPGSKDESECVCAAGYGNYPSCAPCAPGYYSEGGTRGPCTSCGYGLTSPAGSTGPQYCQCPAGYGAVTTGGVTSCGLCPPGTFSGGTSTTPSNPGNASGNAVATASVGSKTSGMTVQQALNSTGLIALTQAANILSTLKSCTPCYNGMLTEGGATDASQCVCVPGTYGPNCLPCPTGAYCEGGKNAKAVLCGDNKTSPTGSRSAADCVCLPGHGSKSCTPCPKGSWSAGSTLAVCTPCPVGFTTATVASTTRDRCMCEEGLSGSVGIWCAICPAGTWSRLADVATGITRECMPCAGNKTSDFGTNDPNKCYCPAGTYGRETCQKCLPGRWCPGGQPNSATAPMNACAGPQETSAPGSQSAQECVCSAGYGGPNCELCPINTYSDGGSRAPCSPCGYGFVTLKPGATSKDYCTCVPGYGNCTTCAAGTYASYGVSGGNIVCKTCPNGKTSDAGATALEQCYCPPGSHGPTCATCIAGSYCPGGSATTPATIISCGVGGFSAPNATSQAECFCQAGYGYNGLTCDTCDFGFYSIGGTRTPCSKCDFGTTTTSKGATSKAQCQCQPGYATNCTMCPAGTWQNGVPGVNGTSLDCKPCESNKTSAPGATDPAQCFCPAGTYGPTCSICVAGSYCPGGSATTAATIASCGSGAFSIAGAKSQAECYCQAGFGFDGAACSQCAANTYSEGGNRTACKPCGTGLISAPGAKGQEFCQCPAGTGASPTNASLCTTCAPGTWANGEPSAQPNPLPCQSCPTGRTSNAGARAVSDCFCPPGTFGINCTTCIAGSWCPGGSSAPINSCGAGMDSPAGSQTESSCVCIAGHGWDGLSCVRCGQGEYAVGGNRTACSKCASGLTSPEGSTSQAACACLPGSGGNCAVCPEGTWSSGLPANNTSTSVTCQSCPSGKTSNLGALSPDDCFCPPGTYGLNCTTCPAGSYCEGGLAAPIQRCPDNMSSPQGSLSISNCFCNAGYGGQSCTLCSIGTYSTGGNRTSCITCQYGLTTAIEGAPSAGFCQCSPGYGASASGSTVTCSVCTAGYWSNGMPSSTSVTAGGATYASCQICPSGRTSNVGAKDANECFCPAGTYQEGDNCTACPANYYCPGGTSASSPGARVFCGSNKKSPPRSSSPDQCVCKPGYGGRDCALCLPGTYSPGDTLDDCKPCPSSMTTEISGATKGEDCVCTAGYGRPSSYTGDEADMVCAPCPDNTYGEAGKRTVCQNCPTNTYTLSSKTSQNDCLCKPGYGVRGTDMNTCVLCGADVSLYSPGGDVINPRPACQACGDFVVDINGKCITDSNPGAGCVSFCPP